VSQANAEGRQPDLLTRDEARGRTALIGDVRYDIDLDLTEQGDTFLSTTTVWFRCSAPGQSTFIDLSAIDVLSIRLNGMEHPPRDRGGHRLHLTGLQPTNELQVVARCAYRNDGAGMHRFVDPVDGATYLYTHFEPFAAHRVFACFDQPDLKAEVRVIVWAPQAWTVIGNTEGHATIVGTGATRWEFERTVPISSYLVAVCAGPYHGVYADALGVRLGLYCRASMARHLDAHELFALTAHGLDYFTTLFDQPYAFSKYDQVFVPEKANAMENAGCVTVGERYLARGTSTGADRAERAEVLLHELAHMWFGNLVTMRWWDDLWLKESFASYLAVRAMAHHMRFPDAWCRFALGTKSRAYAQDQLPTTHPVVAHVPDTDALRLQFDMITYAKGAAVLRQTAEMLGERRFDAGVRLFFAQHAFQTATATDLIVALQQCTHIDLDAWTAPWLRTAGVDVLDVNVDSAGCVTLALTPPRPGMPRRNHVLQLSTYADEDGQLRRAKTIHLRLSGERTSVTELPPLANAALVLANDGDHTYTKVRPDPGSLACMLERLGDLDDPLARSVCWSTLFELVRDALLPARQFVRAVAKHGPPETGHDTTARLLRFAVVATDEYAYPADRNALRSLLADKAWQVLTDSPLDSDRRRIWSTGWVSLVDDDADHDVLRRALEGEGSLTGVRLDDELAWHVLAALARAGDVDDRFLARRRRLDPSDAGRRHCLEILASRPLPAAKDESWWAVLHDADLHEADRLAISRGIHQPAQDHVLQPLAKAYFTELPAIWMHRTVGDALSWTRSMFPLYATDPSMADLADEVATTLPLIGRRVLVEGADNLRRAARARLCDQAAALQQ